LNCDRGILIVIALNLPFEPKINQRRRFNDEFSWNDGVAGLRPKRGRSQNEESKRRMKGIMAGLPHNGFDEEAAEANGKLNPTGSNRVAITGL
jgi:hypothetical protein